MARISYGRIVARDGTTMMKTHHFPCTTVYDRSIDRKKHFCIVHPIFSYSLFRYTHVLRVVIHNCTELQLHVCRIKVRESKKVSPLPPDAYDKDIMSVAWNWTVCDSHGFALDPTFRLPHPPRDSTSVPDEFSILLLQSVHVLPAGVANVGRHRT